MRSTSSPRAVSISTGVFEPASRSCFSTSKPDKPGQHDVENDEVVVLALRAAQALDARRHARELEALGREVLGEHLGKAHVVVDDEQAMVGHG